MSELVQNSFHGDRAGAAVPRQGRPTFSNNNAGTGGPSYSGQRTGGHFRRQHGGENDHSNNSYKQRDLGREDSFHFPKNHSFRSHGTGIREDYQTDLLSAFKTTPFGKLFVDPMSIEGPGEQPAIFSIVQMLQFCPRTPKRSCLPLPDGTLTSSDIFIGNAFEHPISEEEPTLTEKSQDFDLHMPILLNSMGTDDQLRSFLYPLTVSNHGPANSKRPGGNQRGRGRGGRSYEGSRHRDFNQYEDSEPVDEDMWADPSDAAGKFDAAGNFVVDYGSAKATALAAMSTLSAALVLDPADCLPFYPSWYYRDPSGRIQGPFENSQMNEWMLAGYFPPTLALKPATDANIDFQPLQQWQAYYHGHLPWSPEAARILKPEVVERKRQEDAIPIVDPVTHQAVLNDKHVASVSKSPTLSDSAILSIGKVKEISQIEPKIDTKSIVPPAQSVKTSMKEKPNMHFNQESKADVKPLNATLEKKADTNSSASSQSTSAAPILSKQVAPTKPGSSSSWATGTSKNPWGATSTAPVLSSASSISAALNATPEKHVKNTSGSLSEMHSMYEHAQYLDAHELSFDEIQRRSDIAKDLKVDALEQTSRPGNSSAVNLKKKGGDVKNSWDSTASVVAPATIIKADTDNWSVPSPSKHLPSTASWHPVTSPTIASGSEIAKALQEKRAEEKKEKLEITSKAPLTASAPVKPSSWSAVAAAASPKVKSDNSISSQSSLKPEASLPPNAATKKAVTSQTAPSALAVNEWVQSELERLHVSLDAESLTALLLDLSVSEAVELLVPTYIPSADAATPFVAGFFQRTRTTSTKTKPISKAAASKKPVASPLPAFDEEGAFQTVNRSKPRKPKSVEPVGTNGRKVVGL
jgi:GYF domain